MQQTSDPEKKRWHTVIIGAGQAGLASGYFLKKMNKEFIILDKNQRIGDSWRKRWDSLRLFTPSRYDGLPEMPFPGPGDSFPSRDQMADYLESYAMKFSLPVKTGVEVKRLASVDGHYEIDTSSGKIITERVVISTGTHPFPKVPAIASGLSPGILQLHSSGYINPDSLPDGNVLVVGAGTSGIEIALEVSKTRKTFISGKPNFHVPGGLLKYSGGFFWWFISHVVTVRTPVGRKARQKILHGGAPLISVSAKDLIDAGITRLPRMTGTVNGLPQFADGNTMEVSTVIWSTGFRPDFSWIEMDVTDESGWPRTHRGIFTTRKGLYFNGMPFQFGLTSGLVGGVGRDAEYIVRHILNH